MVVDPLLGARDADLAQPFDRPVARLPGGDVTVSITASTSWPTLSTGLSDVIGSWKIIEISLPRQGAQAALGRLEQVLAAKERLPGGDRRVLLSVEERLHLRAGLGAGPTVMRPGLGLRLRIDIIVTLFPDPDSPTTPTVRPGSPRTTRRRPP